MNVLKFQPENKSKLGKIAHFSTMPFKTCYQECSYCYALKSVRMYPSVKSNYEYNTNSLNNGAIFGDIPKKRKVVRMYVSGDFQNLHTINQWYVKAIENKDVMFYGYTKQWKNAKLVKALTILKSLNNVVLRASVDDQIGYDIPNGWVKSGIFEDKAIKGDRYIVCKSTTKNGLKCDTCKICFKKNIESVEVYFPKH